MKRFLIILVLMFIFSNLIFAEEILIKDLGIKCSGKLKTVIKNQNAYKNPYDNIQNGYTTYSGASHRDDQMFRATGEIQLYFGEVGKTEWFGGAAIIFDANDPDTDTGEENEPLIELTDLALMWRPLYVNGGRPFGITAGVQTILPTINGFSTYLFQGDIDLDFPANLVSGLISVPAITVDFHLNQDTGIGITYAKGCSYVSEVGTFMAPDSATTIAYWVRGKFFNIGMTGALQRVIGNRGSTEKIETDSGGSYNAYSDRGYEHFIFNALLSYTVEFSDFKVMPYIGYQRIEGDELPLPDWQDNDASIDTISYAGYGPRKIKGEIKSGGLKIIADFLKRTHTFCAEYSDGITDDFNGIDSLKKGAVNRYIKAPLNLIGMGNSWSMTPISGFGTAVNKLADIDYIINAEWAINYTKNLKMGLFYYKFKSNNDPTINNSSFISQQIEERVKNKLMKENGLNESLQEQ